MKDNKSKTVKILELKQHDGYRLALEKLNELDLVNAEADRQVELMKFKAMQASSEGRRYISMAVALITPGDLVLDRLAARIISVGNISPEVMAEARSGAPKPPSTLDAYDVEIITAVQEASAAKQILSRAITLQRREVSRQKNIAIGEICEAVAPEREKIGRVLASAMLQFGAALRDELAFCERLSAQDASIPAMLSLPPFPLTNSPTDPEAIRWVSQALNIAEREAKHLLAAGGELSREIA